MDDFENLGIFLQVTAMIVLLLKIVSTLDCTGISGRTQILHALVFTTRFLDLPYEFRISLPSFIIKIVYLFIAYLTVASIFIICRRTYEREYDTFRIDLLIGFCTLMGLLSTYQRWEIFAILWYFSIFLEAFAILPQIHFTAKGRYVGSSLVFYIGLLACYRGFYIVHWIYLFAREGLGQRFDYFVVASGFVQFLVYAAYFVWMVPVFKAQYVHLKNVESQSNIVTVATAPAHHQRPSNNGAAVVLMGADSAKRSEASLNNN